MVCFIPFLTSKLCVIYVKNTSVTSIKHYLRPHNLLNIILKLTGLAESTVKLDESVEYHYMSAHRKYFVFPTKNICKLWMVLFMLLMIDPDIDLCQ